MSTDLITNLALIKKEGWEVTTEEGKQSVLVYGQKLPIVHPFSIHGKLYRESGNPQIKYKHFKAMHDYLWPDPMGWHYWTERRFEAHCEGYKYITYAGGASTSKAQPLTAKIRTPAGWVLMGAIKVGDIINSIDGEVQTVTAIHPQGIKEIYKVTFSDGSSTEATGDHLWKVQSKKQRDRNEGKFHIYTTEQISEKIAQSLAIPTIMPVLTYDTADLPIHPWLLGYYIANGSTHFKGSSTITCPTEDLVNKIIGYWPNSLSKKYTDRNCFFLLLRGFRTILREKYPTLFAKKSTEKLIPNEYLLSSINTRMALLQGLLDGDGSASGPGISASFSNKLLARQVVDLARGLGYLVSVAEDTPTHYVKDNKKTVCTPCSKIYISIPKYLPVPATRIKVQERVRDAHRIIKSVEYLRHDYAQCITVSHCSNLYITDDFIVTHNSHDAAKIALLFWLADPRNRAVIVASTSLASLNARIWGYITKFLNESIIKFNYKMMMGAPPQILYERKDQIHGMFAVAAKQGDDDASIASWIGRHPKKGLLMILDEATDMPSAILKAVPNLEASQETFQLMAIGNSLSKFDLHGSLSTPAAGWKSVNPLVDTKWETTQKNGICLFFSCYESPAIHEVDPVKRARLGKFLITQEEVKAKENLYGARSDAFFRFILGYWRDDASDDVIISSKFLHEFNVKAKAEWSGLYPLTVVAGLDPAFSQGGDQCVLRLGILGHLVNGQMVLDFNNQNLLFVIKILANAGVSSELQIADQVIKILNDHRCSLQNLAVDANGQGRALAEVIRLRARSLYTPIKIYSTRLGTKATKSFDVTIKNPYELWTTMRDFIQTDQIRGLDVAAAMQLTSRWFVTNKQGRHVLEGKKEYKNRMGSVSPTLAHSPDEADAAVLALQVAIINHGFHPGMKKDVTVVSGFETEKYMEFTAQEKMVREEHSKNVGPPVADFNGDLADLKPFVPF